MIYTSFSLCGSWEMDYSETEYKGTAVPVFDGFEIENAVPGYWEDMTYSFQRATFFRNLKVNPSFGYQQYPIASNVPDMALPNYMGNFYYRRVFTYELSEQKAVIHFEGVQNTLSMWINDTYIGRHEGYSTPFDMEIPAGVLKPGENTIILSVSNLPLTGIGGGIVSGLTNRAANEYTGGITGNVELRIYNSPLRDAHILISDDCKTADVKLDMTENCSVNWRLYDGDTLVKNGSACGDFTFDTDSLTYWSPENPKLYRLEISCGKGSICLDFGVRKLLAKGTGLTLNGNPYFLRGVCEHCYFPETVHPDHDAKYYRNIIKSLKKLGFNFIRFHTYIPEEEYMQAADELGMLLHVESPNNTTLEEWKEIVTCCSRHSSVVIYCCGNELFLDKPFIDHLHNCADVVHSCTDGMFSPMSALRGVEYCCDPNDSMGAPINEPFTHNPQKLNELSKFTDVYSSFANELLSYSYISADPEVIDSWSIAYNKPRISHEICIDGTYTDLSLKDRYKNSRISKTDMFTSVERHLEDKDVLQNAPMYFVNSCKWQRRVRKYCFEITRRCSEMAGFDFLGPIDTHWHTFGYDVGMMNEFYELKPDETVRNVLMYNSPTVLLNDLGTKVNFESGELLSLCIYASHYGSDTLKDAVLTVRLSLGDKIIERKSFTADYIKNGTVSRLCGLGLTLPEVETPAEMKLYVTLDGGDIFAENEWELYLFPKVNLPAADKLIISDGMSAQSLKEHLINGDDVLIFGTEPFTSFETTFKIALAGRTSGNLSTVVYDHPVLKDMPHDGFCGWQFSSLMENGRAVCFESKNVPFNPIVEVVSPHKFVVRQSSLFEFRALNGRLLVCSMNFADDDPAANWLKSKLISYAKSNEFNPESCLDEKLFDELIYSKVQKAQNNENLAFNVNDKAAVRKN